MNTNQNFKSGFVTIIGRPNVGKSTLINNILKEKLLITSSKPQTTRNTIRLIYTDDEMQLIFLDTPGIHKPKTKLGTYMSNSAENTLREVDGIVYMVEPEEKIGPGDRYIMEKLKTIDTPKILVINKIDQYPKEQLLSVIENYSQDDIFDEIIPISAANGDGVDLLLDILKEKMPQGPKYFPEDMIIDQSERFIVQELIREKLLRTLRDEIPHGIAVEVTSMKVREDSELYDIEATIFCEKKSHKGIVIGKKGGMLKKIGTDARKDLEFFLKQPVNLQLWVKVRPDWRDKSYDLKDLGYHD
ncbi:MAG: GTPase Era [Eubacteriaceae bacterium]|nr:GTPase Era [Eubacteriaceae bacterium]